MIPSRKHLLATATCTLGGLALLFLSTFSTKNSKISISPSLERNTSSAIPRESPQHITFSPYIPSSTDTRTFLQPVPQEQHLTSQLSSLLTYNGKTIDSADRTPVHPTKIMFTGPFHEDHSPDY